MLRSQVAGLHGGCEGAEPRGRPVVAGQRAARVDRFHPRQPPQRGAHSSLLRKLYLCLLALVIELMWHALWTLSFHPKSPAPSRSARCQVSVRMRSAPGEGSSA